MVSFPRSRKSQLCLSEARRKVEESFLKSQETPAWDARGGFATSFTATKKVIVVVRGCVFECTHTEWRVVSPTHRAQSAE